MGLKLEFAFQDRTLGRRIMVDGGEWLRSGMIKDGGKTSFAAV